MSLVLLSALLLQCKCICKILNQAFQQQHGTHTIRVAAADDRVEEDAAGAALASVVNGQLCLTACKIVNQLCSAALQWLSFAISHCRGEACPASAFLVSQFMPAVNRRSRVSPNKPQAVQPCVALLLIKANKLVKVRSIGSPSLTGDIQVQVDFFQPLQPICSLSAAASAPAVVLRVLAAVSFAMR